MRKKHVIITGIAGFIGSHLCRKFLSEGFKVTGFDNLLTGNEDNIREFYNHPDFTFTNFDVTNFISFYGEVDYILHFASPASPFDYAKYPIQTLKVNSLGTHNCLGLGKYKNARVIIGSTSEIYGDPLEHPQKETYYGHTNSIGLRSCYDESKRYAEALTMTYNRFYGVNTGIVRLFNCYGANLKLGDGRAIPTFFKQALLNEDITMFGDGSQTRSFTYVDDTIDGIYRLTVSDYHLPVNIGSTQEVTLIDLAKEIIELTGSKSKIIYQPLPSDDPKQRRPDITRAKEVLRWQPITPLRDGLIKTMPYYERQLKTI